MKISGLFLLLILFSMTISWSRAQSVVGQNLDKPREFSFFEDKVLAPRSDAKIFPNPATDYLTIELKDQNMTSVEFEMNNIIGNVISLRSEKLEGNRYKFYVKDLPAGYYFLTVKDNDTGYKRAYRFVKK